MEKDSKDIEKRKRNSIKIELKGNQVNISIFYSLRSYEIFNKSFSETNNYKEAFLITIHEMIFKDTTKFDNVTIEDVEQIKIEDLEKIAKHIINSSGLLEELKKNAEFNNSDWFKKIYLMNKKIGNNLKNTTLKIQNNINLIHRDIDSISKSVITPLKNVYSQVEGVGKNYSQYLNGVNKYQNLVSPGMKSLMGLSGQMAQIMNPINNATKLALTGVRNNMKQLAVASNAYRDISVGVTMQLQKQSEPLRAGLLNIQKNVQKVGLQMGLASQALQLHSFKYDKIISNINSTREALINSNIQGIRSALMEAQVGSRLLESQLKGIKQSLSFVTKFNYGDKLISFDSLNKNILKGIRPFITDLNSIILSRNNIKESIKNKAEAMNSFDWWIISSLPITIINEIDKNKEKLAKDEVDYIICNFYNESNFKELDRVVEKWANLSYFNNRVDILKDSIEVHKIGKYSLTVPTLVPIIEGVIREFMLNKYKIFDKSFQPIYRSFKDKMEELNNFIATYVIVCIDKLYCKFNPVNPNKVSDFSRHKISHGLATKYGSQANSLRVILFLDEIFEIISSIQELDLAEVI